MLVVLLALAGDSLLLLWGGPLLDELCWGALGVQALAQVASGLALVVQPGGLRQRVALEARAWQIPQGHAGWRKDSWKR